MKLRRWGRLLVLAIFAVMTLTGASWPLQPLVEVKTSRTSAAPAGCDESLVPAPAPRLEVKQIPPPEQIVTVALAAPPSSSLRSEVQAAHRALTENNRPAFDEHLRTTHAILQSYPAGGERTAAEDVVRVLDDASHVWDAQFESPFFDERSDEYARLNRYPGYSDAVRRGMLTDDADRRYYPAGESREFLTRVAADRLPRLGVRTETRVARNEPRVTPAPRHSSTPRKHTTVPKQAERTTIRPRAYTPPRSSSRTKISRKAPTAPRSMPAAPDRPSAAQAATESSSRTPDRVAAPRTTVAAPPPVPTDTYATTTTAAATPAPATTTTSAPVTTETVAPEVTQTTATDTATERRSIVVPALLILIGLGVLILLFRAAS